jgi:Rieske Fe-S protein
MEKPPQRRRTFIKTLILILAALPLLGRFLMPRVKRQTPLLKIDKKDLPGGGALVFRESKIAVISAGRGIEALSLACTHLGCTLNATPKGFTCPCHGSVFNTSGKVLRGPADRPLPRLAVEERGDHIVVMS